MNDLNVAAVGEIHRLARMLEVGPADLAYLQRFDALEIRALRMAVATAMHADNQHTYARIARASKLLPAKVTAALAQRGLSPSTSAGVVGELSPQHTADLAGRMSSSYLADVCVHLAPAAVAPVLELLDDDVLLATLAEFVSRRDVETMAEIVLGLSDEQVLLVLDRVEDPILLLDTLVRVSDPSAVDRLLTIAPVETLRRVAVAASRKPGVWTQTLALLGRLPAPTRKRVLAGLRAS